jgi:hypothetical protein
MMGFIPKISKTLILFSSMALFGCGGSGDSGTSIPVYSGSISPAAMTASNAEHMGRGATEGVNESVNLMSVGDGIPFAVDISSSNTALAQKVKDIAIKVLDGTNTPNLPAGLVITADELNAETGTNEFCGGSATVPDNIDPNSSLNFTMTFNSLCFDDGITVLVMSGTLTFAETATEFSITFANFSVNIDGTQESFSGTFTCDTSLCTISTDFAGSDGNIYKISNVDISGDAVNGYYISADFYHYALGVVSISTTIGITYGNCGIYPDGGVITLISTGGSYMSVTYNLNCTFTVEGFDGSGAFGPDTLTW